MLTWRHVERRSTTKVRSVRVRSGKAEVSKLDGVAVVSDQNILRLQVPVVDAQGVAVSNGVQDLEECTSGKFVIAGIPSALSDVGEQIAVGAVLQNYVCAFR